MSLMWTKPSDSSSKSHFRSNTQMQVVSNFILKNTHGETSTNDHESREGGP